MVGPPLEAGQDRADLKAPASLPEGESAPGASGLKADTPSESTILSMRAGVLVGPNGRAPPGVGKEGRQGTEMLNDPYMYIRLHEDEIRRKVTQNARESEARLAKAEMKRVEASVRTRTNPGRVGALAWTFGLITRVFGLTRQGA